jgi:hypothetical protein
VYQAQLYIQQPYLLCRLLLLLDNQTTPNLVEIKQLLAAGHDSGLPVCGLYLAGLASQGPEDLPVLATWLRLARSLYAWAADSLGLNLSRLHIGELAAMAVAASASQGGSAGFCCTAQVGELLDALFPVHLGVEITAAATRYLVGPAITLAARVVAVRERSSAAFGSHGPEMHYYINEGVFGAFSGLLWDNNGNGNNTSSGSNISFPAVPFPLGGVKNRKVVGHRYFGTSIRGPSGDELDIIADDVLLPRLDEDDWLLFPGLGCLNDTGYGRSSCIDGSANYIYRKGGDGGTAGGGGSEHDLHDELKSVLGLSGASNLPPFCEGFSVDLDTWLSFSSGAGARPDIDLKNTFLFED